MTHDWEQYSGPAVCKRCGVVSADRSYKGPCLTWAERREAIVPAPEPKFIIKPIFAWYDMWIGAFWDSPKRRLYIFPVPMFGIVIQFGTRPDAETEGG